MITKIKIYNRFRMDMYANTEFQFFPYDSWYMISVYSEDDEYATHNKTDLFKSKGCRGFLSLGFSDITEDIYEKIDKIKYPKVKLFDKDQARKIFEFLYKINKDEISSVLVVHCDAGISRSGAIGTFASDYYGLNYNEFIGDNAFILSNQYVLKLLRDVSGYRPLAEWHDGIDRIQESHGIILT